MSGRIENLESRRLQLEDERRLVLAQKPQFDITGIKEKIAITMDEFSKAFDIAPNSKKRELLQAFVDHIEVNQTQRKATCYIRKFPLDVKVFKCRRSRLERNRHKEFTIYSTHY